LIFSALTKYFSKLFLLNTYATNIGLNYSNNIVYLFICLNNASIMKAYAFFEPNL